MTGPHAKANGADKYQVYRATSKNGTSVTIKSNLVSGITYYYKVIAVHSMTAANSAYSSIKSITVK